MASQKGETLRLNQMPGVQRGVVVFEWGLKVGFFVFRLLRFYGNIDRVEIFFLFGKYMEIGDVLQRKEIGLGRKDESCFVGNSRRRIGRDARGKGSEETAALADPRSLLKRLLLLKLRKRSERARTVHEGQRQFFFCQKKEGLNIWKNSRPAGGRTQADGLFDRQTALGLLLGQRVGVHVFVVEVTAKQRPRWKRNNRHVKKKERTRSARREKKQ